MNQPNLYSVDNTIPLPIEVENALNEWMTRVGIETDNRVFIRDGFQLSFNYQQEIYLQALRQLKNAVDSLGDIIDIKILL